jgi:hypothetical protein
MDTVQLEAMIATMQRINERQERLIQRMASEIEDTLEMLQVSEATGDTPMGTLRRLMCA